MPRHMVRTYMSTLTEAAPHDDESRFMLILGKPGGGKGTISQKILQVRRMEAVEEEHEMTATFLLMFF